MANETFNPIRGVIKSVDGAITLALKIRTKSRSEGPLKIIDSEPPLLEWGVGAAPIDGAANSELTRAVAELFDLPKHRVKISIGLKSKLKIVRIEGITAEDAVRIVSQRL